MEDSKVLAHSLLPQRRAFVKKCIEAIILDPVEKTVHVKLDINPFLVKNTDTKRVKKLEVSAFDTSSEMVAGVHIHRVWKFKNKVRRASSADVISKICHKKSFSRHFMEKTMGISKSQSYWYIQYFLRNNLIEKLDIKKIYEYDNHPQTLYKYIGNAGN